MKVRFDRKDSAFDVIKNAGRLRTLQHHKGFMKPDKTTAERAEFQRIGKKKEELTRHLLIQKNFFNLLLFLSIFSNLILRERKVLEINHFWAAVSTEI